MDFYFWGCWALLIFSCSGVPSCEKRENSLGKILWKFYGKENICLIFWKWANQADLLMTQKITLLIRAFVNRFLHFFVLVPNLDVIRNIFFTLKSLSMSQPETKVEAMYSNFKEKFPHSPSWYLFNIRCLSSLFCLHWTIESLCFIHLSVLFSHSLSLPFFNFYFLTFVHVGGEGMSLGIIIQSSVARSIFSVIHMDSLYLNNLFILACLVQQFDDVWFKYQSG